ncbi:MAG: hypothetical protein M1541_14440, partial [Acidobacteria bacterium]|nr:hypothetical protein [Acidobacteriota bacterium]
KAKIVSHNFTPDRSEVRIDLSQAYPDRIKRFERTVALLDRKQVAVTDEIQAARPVEALWGMVTTADVTVDGKRAELRKGGATLAAEIVSPAGASPCCGAAAGPPP